MANKMTPLCIVILASIISLGQCSPACSHEISKRHLLSSRHLYSDEVEDDHEDSIIDPLIVKDDAKTQLGKAVQSLSFVRRSLSPLPMASEHNQKSLSHTKGKHVGPLKNDYKYVGKDEIRLLLKKLKAAVKFRENIIFIFSYLLHGHKNVLTEHQYASLQMIYDLLRKKRVYIYNMLPILSTFRHADKNKQTQTVLASLKNNLPQYLHCAVMYLQNEIKSGKLDLNVLLKPTKLEEYDYLDDLDAQTLSVCSTEKCNDGIDPYDEDSQVTQDALGPVYVKIQKQLEMKNIPLTQELFGLILINLPNPEDDPVLEENIKYVYDITTNNLIKDWMPYNEKLLVEVQGNSQFHLKGPYKYIILAILTNLPNTNLPWVVRNALVYILFHLKPVTVTNVDPNVDKMYAVTNNGIHIFSLLTSIVTPEFSPDAKHLSDALLHFFAKNLEKKYLDEVFDFNRFAYSDPLDLLLALLTRIKTRAPPSQIELLRPATALLGMLIFKKDARIFSPSMTNAIDIPILLDTLNAQHLGPKMPPLADSLRAELLRKPLIITHVNEEIPISKESCRAPRQCLLKTMGNIVKLHNVPKVVLITIERISTFLIPEINGDTYNNETDSKEPLQPGEYDTDKSNPMIQKLKKPGLPEKADSDEIPEVMTHKSKKKHKGSTGSRSVSSNSDSAPSEDDSSIHPSDSGESKIVAPNEKSDDTNSEESAPDSASLLSDNTGSSLIEPDNSQDEGSIEEHPSKYHNKHPSKHHSKHTNKHPSKHTTKSPEDSIEGSDYSEKSKTKSPDKHRTEKPDKWPEPMTSEEFDVVQISSEERPITDEGTVILPPSIEPNKTMYIEISEHGVTVITTDTTDKSKPRDALPSVSILLQEPDPERPLQDLSPQVEKKILQPLKVIFGKQYIQKILGGPGRTDRYPTNIALLLDLLEAAMKNPKVKRNNSLMAAIKSYIVNLEYIAVTVLLPVVVSSERITTDVVYSTFDPSNPSSASLSNTPPLHKLPGMVTIALTNPQRWLESVNSTNPYDGLIPDLPRGLPEEIKLRPLKHILAQKKIFAYLGKGFNPQIYPTRGALLVTMLRKLLQVEEVKLNSELTVLIEQYLKALELPSMYTKVPINLIMNTVTQPTGKWQPELSSLLQALPPPSNVKEFTMIKAMHDFLVTPNLLIDLGLSTPSMTTTRGEFLKAIITAALRSDKIVLSEPKSKALKYYKNKVLEIGPGELPLLWVWVRVYVLKTEVKLGNLIENTIIFDKLPYKHKLAYNELISYFSEHPEMLQDNQNFEFEKYKTQGEFLKGLLKYLLKKQGVNKTVKKNIQILLPYVQLTGSGAIKIPTSVQTIEQKK